MPPLTRSEIVGTLAKNNPHLLRKDIEKIVETVLGSISTALEKGNRVELRSFGVFNVKTHAGGSVRRNPRTGEKIITEASRAPTFKVSKHLREHINKTGL